MRLTARLVVGALLVAWPHLRAQEVRPTVVALAHVEGELYRAQLQDPACSARCAALGAELADSVRVLLAQRFGFIDWQPRTASAPDTLVLVWANLAESQNGVLLLSLRGVHASPEGAPLRIPFESFDAIIARPAADWRQPAVVRAHWLGRLRTLLARPSESGRIVTSTLSRIPLREHRVQFTPAVDAEGDVLLGIGPRALRADALRNPSFLLRMRVRDPASDPAARVDETEARLDGCSLTEDRRYRCGVTLFDYPHRMPREHPRDRAYYRALAQRARRDVLTLHLQAYFPDDASADAPVRRPPD